MLGAVGCLLLRAAEAGLLKNKLDPFDPNGWLEPGPQRIWLDDYELAYCIVDPEDYDFLVQWTWYAKPDKHERKFYACRNTRIDGKQRCVFLHKEVLVRAKGLAPSSNYTIGDHLNGMSLDCRRLNLRWATPKMNRANIGGWMAQQMGLNI